MAVNYTPTQGMDVPMDDAPELAPTFRLFDLPVELQIMCLKALCDHCREINGNPLCCMHEGRCNFECRRALARFCLASRHSRRLAQPILHHRVQVGRMGQGGTGKLGPLLRLLRTLVMRPDLAAQVRTIALSMNMVEFELPLTQDERRMIMDTADQLQVSTLERLIPGQVCTWIATPVTLPRTVTPDWPAARVSGFRRYAASLLIALASNATTLNIKDCFDRVDVEFKHLMHVAFTGLMQLKLRRLRVEGETQCQRSLAELAFFFRLAPITELTVVRPQFFICPGALGPAGIPLPVKALASLTRLDLLDTELTANDFRAMIQHCPNLEHLTSLALRPVWPSPQLPGAATFIPARFPATPREISEILSHSLIRHKLKTLFIECPREHLAQHTPGTIGTLHALTNLERLIIGGNALLGSYKSPLNPNWQREHGEGDARLANILPPGLLHLDMFNLAYHPGGVYNDPEMGEFLAAYKADVAREREQTGVRRPRALEAIGFDRGGSWYRLVIPTCGGPQLPPGRFLCYADFHLYDESG